MRKDMRPVIHICGPMPGSYQHFVELEERIKGLEKHLRELINCWDENFDMIEYIAEARAYLAGEVEE